jgi:hypothetical protein
MEANLKDLYPPNGCDFEYFNGTLILLGIFDTGGQRLAGPTGKWKEYAASDDFGRPHEKAL